MSILKWMTNIWKDAQTYKSENRKLRQRDTSQAEKTMEKTNYISYQWGVTAGKGLLFHAGEDESSFSCFGHIYSN